MKPNDQRVDRIIAIMLRTGVLTAASVVALAGAWYLSRFGTVRPNYRSFHGEPQDLRSVGGICQGVLALDPRSLIQFGLLLLIATPIARVAFSVVAFAVERDRLYLAITALVLLVLLWSLSGMGYAPR